MNPPKLEHYVNDASKVLSESVRHEVNERLKNHDTQTTVQAVVYLFPHRQGRELLDIGLEIFNENGIGQKDTNNGLLLIVATEEKKLRIITGKGMEFEWNTEKCKYIVEQILRPLLNAGKYDEMAKAWCDCVLDKRNMKQILDDKKGGYRQLALLHMPTLCFLGFVSYGFTKILFGPYLSTYGYHNTSLIIILTFVLIVFYGLGFKLVQNLQRKLYIFVSIAWLCSYFGIFTLQTYFIIDTDYSSYRQVCLEKKICLIDDSYFTIWKKYTRINFEQNLVDRTRERAQYEEDKRLHPEKYQYSSSDSDSSSSSSDSDFGGGGGSSNGGGYGD